VQPFHRTPDALGKLPDAGASRPCGHDDESVAIVAGEHVLDVEQVPNASNDRAEHPIACEVAKMLVDLLERVDANHQDGHLAVRPLGAGKLGQQAAVKVVAMEYARHRIVHGRIVGHRLE